MSTRGALIFVHQGIEKTTYNHDESGPDGLGWNILRWLRSDAWNLEVARQQVAELRMVSSVGVPTADEVEKLARYAVNHNCYYSLLRRTQGIPRAILEAGIACDASGWQLDSTLCCWAYVIDLDQEIVEVYGGGPQWTRPAAGRWASIDEPDSVDGCWPVDLQAVWTIADARACLGGLSESGALLGTLTRPEVVIESFGYLHGPPPGASIILDVRTVLRNPHADPAMRELRGLDQPVRDHVLATLGARGIVQSAARMVATLLTCQLPHRGQVRFAIGCASGRHRSVALAEELRDVLAKRGVDVAVSHRDVSRPVVEHSEAQS